MHAHVSLLRRTLKEQGLVNGAADPKLLAPPPLTRAPAAAAEPAGDESEAEELAWLAAQHKRLGPLRTPQVRLSRQFTSVLHSVTTRPWETAETRRRYLDSGHNALYL